MSLQLTFKFSEKQYKRILNGLSAASQQADEIEKKKNSELATEMIESKSYQMKMYRKFKKAMDEGKKANSAFKKWNSKRSTRRNRSEAA